MNIRKTVCLLMLVILLSGCSRQSKMSLDEYEQIPEGLSYRTTAFIAGSGGEPLEESSPSGMQKYSWKGYGSSGASAILEFQDGKVAGKSQQGLEYARKTADDLDIEYRSFIDAFLDSVIYTQSITGDMGINLDSYGYEPNQDGTSLRSYTVWETAGGGMVRLEAVCDKRGIAQSIQVLYRPDPEEAAGADIYDLMTTYSVNAYVAAQYALVFNDPDVTILSDALKQNKSLGSIRITVIDDNDGAKLFKIEPIGL